MARVEIKAVRCYGQGLRVMTDGTDEVIVATDTVDAEVAALSGFTGGLAIDFDNGFSLFVGDEDGYGPTKAWLTKDGENWPVVISDMARIKLSPRFEIVIPE